MNRTFTQNRFILAVCLSFSFIFCAAQPDYTFKNCSLISGTDLQPGAVYSFPDVRSGVDARITIISETGGVTLSSIDEPWTGFDEAFQPFIHVDPMSDGYIEFQIDFVTAGTATLLTQSKVPVTCIDIDGVDMGDGYIYERDQIKLQGGYYIFDFLGMNIQVTNQSGWIQAENTSGWSYPGIDTTAKDVMYTVVNRNVSSVMVRIGARNTSATKAQVRYRSVYFKEFYYGAFEPLASRSLIHFSGNARQNTIELKGLLSEGDGYDKIILEKGRTSTTFEYMAELSVTSAESAKYSFTYTDTNPYDGNNYYRVKLINSATGRVELSRVLMVKTSDITNGLGLMNTLVQKSNPVLAVKADNNYEALLQVSDMAGRVYVSKNIRLNAGINNLQNITGNMPIGYGILVLQSGAEKISAKILLQ
jgi:hypothetical protein